MRGTVFPVSSLGIPRKSTSKAWSGHGGVNPGSQGRWGLRRLRQVHAEAWRPAPLIGAELDLLAGYGRRRRYTSAEFEQFGAPAARVGGEAAAHDQRVGITYCRQPRIFLRASTGGHRESAREAHVVHRNLMAGGLLASTQRATAVFDTGETEIMRVRGTGLCLVSGPSRHFDGVRVAVLTMAVDVRAADTGSRAGGRPLSKHSPPRHPAWCPPHRFCAACLPRAAARCSPPETIRASVS